MSFRQRLQSALFVLLLGLVACQVASGPIGKADLSPYFSRQHTGIIEITVREDSDAATYESGSSKKILVLPLLR